MIGISAPNQNVSDDQKRALIEITREWQTEEIPLIAKFYMLLVTKKKLKKKF